MAFDQDTDPSVTDLAITRERVWRKTNKKNRYRREVIEDTGWDLVSYDELGMGVEPGVSVFEQRADGKVSDRRYTGILILSEGDTMLRVATSTGGPIPRGAF